MRVLSLMYSLDCPLHFTFCLFKYLWIGFLEQSLDLKHGHFDHLQIGDQHVKEIRLRPHVKRSRIDAVFFDNLVQHVKSVHVLFQALTRYEPLIYFTNKSIQLFLEGRAPLNAVLLFFLDMFAGDEGGVV